MGRFWASETSESTAKCPVNHEAMVCPVKTDAVQCPVTNSQEFLDPSNNMPFNISSERAPGQKVVLPTERTISTIPRGESEDQGFWSYPSPQQMLNAMLKKGKGSIPEDAVESMVDVHNFLNEGAWQEILEWEKPYTQESHVGPRLSKFTGRPFDRTPRAQWFLFLSDWFPQTFNNNPPFDRHDWTVLRSEGVNKGWKDVRYVIDYYGGPDDQETGMPTFFLDVRPSLDNFTNAKDRFIKWSVPVWNRAMGEIKDKD